MSEGEGEDRTLMPSPRSRVKAGAQQPAPPTAEKPAATARDVLRIDPERRKLLDSLTVDELFYAVMRFGDIMDRVRQLSGVGVAPPQRFSPPVPRPRPSPPAPEAGRRRTVPLPEGVKPDPDMMGGIDLVEQRETGSVGGYPQIPLAGEGGGMGELLMSFLIANPKLGDSIANLIDTLTNKFSGFMEKFGKPKGGGMDE